MVANTSKKKVLGFDIAIWDFIFKLADCPELNDSFNIGPGSKGEITHQQAATIRQLLEDKKIEITGGPGGSTSNVFRTKAKLLGKDNVDLTFVTALGVEEHAKLILDALKELGIKVITQEDGVHVDTAYSYVPKWADRDRSTMTNRGNAKEVITKKLFPEELIEGIDSIVMQGSAAAKFASGEDYDGKSESELIDHVLVLRAKFDKQLVLALPTTAFQPKYFEYLVCSADIVTSNVKELGYLFHIELDDEPESEDPELEKKTAKRDAQVEKILLRFEELQKKSTHVLENNLLTKHDKQVAFITDGGNGCYVMRDGKPREHVKACAVEMTEDGCSLGCGDTFVGAITAYLDVDQSIGCNIRAAEFASAVAAANLRNPVAVMDAPLEEARNIAPHVVESFERKREAKYPSQDAAPDHPH